MQTAYDGVVLWVRLLTQAFFRDIEVVGLEHIPRDRGGVLVSWHPNGVIDPGVILACFPVPVTFGARSGLFQIPGFSLLLRAVGAVPVFRAQDHVESADPEARRLSNGKALDQLAASVVRGRYSCLFPEGDSHDNPFLLDLKTGAARFYYRACALSPAGNPPPVLIPVGLHYDKKHAFRSQVLVEFHPPLDLAGELAWSPEDPEDRHRIQRLTTELDRVLREVVRATESWEVHHLMHRVRKLLRAERARRAGAVSARPNVRERQLGFARVWHAVSHLEVDDPERLVRLRARVFEYDADLRALGLDDHELDRAPDLFRPGFLVVALAQATAVVLFLPPLLVVGLGIHLPVALVLWGVSWVAARRRKDVASIKLVVGSVLVPATWMLVALLAGFAHERLHAAYPGIPNTPVLAGVMVGFLSLLGAVSAVRYLRLLSETLRAVKVRLTRVRRVATLRRLREERAALTTEMETIAAQYALPGRIASDGRVEDAPTALGDGA